MKTFIAITLFVAVTAALKSTDFESFKTKFGKSYKTATEEEFRLRIFEENLRIINNHNALFRKGKTSFEMAINKFSDLTNEEFTEKYTGVRPPVNYKAENVFASKDFAAPDFIDWRTAGYVTRVKDQGGCGSCWAFSASGALEGAHRRSKSVLVELSEQNLVDCSTVYGNHGCSGGWMNNAFNYGIANGGIDTEASYPYNGMDGTCKFNPNTVGSTVGSIVNIPKGNEDALKQACAAVGPIAVAIDAGGSGFQSYKTGVYDNPACTDVVTHAVLVVGYGTLNGVDYWLCKNSWGENWGDKGYIKMSRNKNNQCCIATYASYPVV